MPDIVIPCLTPSLPSNRNWVLSYSTGLGGDFPTARAQPSAPEGTGHGFIASIKMLESRWPYYSWWVSRGLVWFDLSGRPNPGVTYAWLSLFKGAAFSYMSYSPIFGDRSIDMVILTHPDADHINGLIEVLERYDVEIVLENFQVKFFPFHLEILLLSMQLIFEVFLEKDLMFAVRLFL